MLQFFNAYLWSDINNVVYVIICREVVMCFDTIIEL